MDAECAAIAEAQRRLEVQVRAAEQQLSESVKLPWRERKQVLRELQLRWHPDMQYGGGETLQERGNELAAKVNEAMRVAKANAKLRGEL